MSAGDLGSLEKLLPTALSAVVTRSQTINERRLLLPPA